VYTDAATRTNLGNGAIGDMILTNGVYFADEISLSSGIFFDDSATDVFIV
jgi:hypothetical protein